jgi:hypothetical protein
MAATKKNAAASAKQNVTQMKIGAKELARKGKLAVSPRRLAKVQGAFAEFGIRAWKGNRNAKTMKNLEISTFVQIREKFAVFQKQVESVRGKKDRVAECRPQSQISASWLPQVWDLFFHA